MFYEISIWNLIIFLRATVHFLCTKNYFWVNIATNMLNTFEISLPGLLKEIKISNHLDYQARWISETYFFKISAYSLRCIREQFDQSQFHLSEVQSKHFSQTTCYSMKRQLTELWLEEKLQTLIFIKLGNYIFPVI